MRARRRRETRDTAAALDRMDTDRVRAVLYLCGMPPDALDDGVQQVGLRLLEQPPGRVRDVRAWTAAVAANVAADAHRARRREEDLVAQLGARAREAPGRPDEDTALAVSIAAGLRALPPDQRRLVVLRFYLDLPVREIAAELGIPEGTVKSRLHTAVGVVRQQLHRMEEVAR